MSTLQIIWFILVAVLLIGYAILDGFDLGAGLLHLFTKEESERVRMYKAIGPYWDGNEVWLLTGGGAIFAAYPPVYASVFSGFYLALILVLAGLIFRAVAIEFRKHSEKDCEKRMWDVLYSIGCFLPALLFGVAVGNIIRGIELDQAGNYIGGFFALLNPFALIIGLAGLFMFALHGGLFLAFKTDGVLQEKIRRWTGVIWWPYFLLYTVASLGSALLYARASVTLSLVVGLLALLSAALVKVLLVKKLDFKAFLLSCVAITLSCVGVATIIFPRLVPARFDDNLSLTIFNASSSYNTLLTMFILALIGVPIVLSYTAYYYRIFRGKV